MTATAAETFLQAVDSLLDGRVDKFLLWIIGATGIFCIAFLGESLKVRGGQSFP